MNTIWPNALPAASGPKYKTVAAIIRDAVHDGRLKPGGRLPPVRELAWQLRITPGTVARAYTVLTDEGALVAEVGRGTFVAEPAKAADTSADPLIEMDVVPHKAGQSRTSESYAVNLFSPALPNVGQSDLLRRALAKVAQAPASGLMHYPTRAAQKPAREAALHWLSEAALGAITEEDVVLTHGGQGAIGLVLQAILEGRRPTVLVEELAYPGFRRVAELLRAEVVSVPMDAHGIIPEALERALIQHGAQALCTSPEVHNPTLVFTPIKRRREIVAVARRHGLQIIEDDCYRMGPTRAPSYRLLAPDLGWYISSVAKTLSPALRLGFAIAPEGKTAQLRRAVEHGFFGLPTPMTDLAALVLGDPEVQVLADKARDIYGTYSTCAKEVLSEYRLSANGSVPFLWLELPEGWRATAFCQAAAEASIKIRAAEEFAARDARVPHAARIAINAAHGLQSFRNAMLRLRALLDNPREQIGI
ncbi:MAG: PLP-dependent aminotransferase family protein [Sulfitobacter sp.]